LGLSRFTLREKLKQLGLHPGQKSAPRLNPIKDPTASETNRPNGFASTLISRR
jgi:hypothetical protein